jgi:hypothetical protein
MAIGSDFEIQNDKDIRYTGVGPNYTVLELHRWLQDRADDASSSSDDYMDITRDTPSDKSFDTIINLINSYNIDDTTAQYLYGGSIIQDAGNTIYDGLQVLAPSGMYLSIMQSGILATPNFWTSTLNPDPPNGISHQFMLKVRSNGFDIDGRRLVATTREWGKTFLEFKINGTARGVNVMAFTGWADDLNNTTASGTVAAYTTIGNSGVGYTLIDINNDTVTEPYYSKWNRDTYSINQFYERMKWISARGTGETLYGLNAGLFRGITHQWNYADETNGPFTESAEITWLTGKGQLLALLDSGTTGTMWIQLKSGVAPSAGDTISQTGGKTCTVNGAVTERAVSTPFCGQSTGTSLIGAFGFALEALDLTASDKVFDLTNTLRQAPNYVTFTVGGLIDGHDYVLVAPADGSAIDTNQFTLNGALSGAIVTSVIVNEDIAADTPSTGTIRIQRANGAYTRHPYSAYNAGTKTFTITSHDFSSNNASNAANCYISYIDDVVSGADNLSFTSVYTTDRNLFIRVRDGGASPIKTFETTGVLGSAGGSATAVRTSDL